jgi:hypothetical protein
MGSSTVSLSATNCSCIELLRSLGTFSPFGCLLYEMILQHVLLAHFALTI